MGQGRIELPTLGFSEEAKKNDPDMGFEEFALSQMKLYKANVKSGSGPKSPKEKRTAAAEREAQEQTENDRLQKDATTFERFFIDTYLPQAKADKKDRSVAREEGLFNNWMKEIIGDIAMRDVIPFHMEMLKKLCRERDSPPDPLNMPLP